MKAGFTRRILRRFSGRKPPMDELAAARAGLATSAFRLAAYSPDDLLSGKGYAI